MIEGTIYGTITGSDTGTGIPATLVFTETTTAETHTGPTLADGWYYANTLSYGTWTVSISSPGYQTANQDHSPSPPTTPRYNLDVALDPDDDLVEGTIYGTITGSDTGTGIPANLVFTETTTSETHTDPTLADGWYYANTLSYGTWTVSHLQPRLPDRRPGPFTLTTADPEFNLDVALDLPMSLSATVTGTVRGLDQRNRTVRRRRLSPQSTADRTSRQLPRYDLQRRRCVYLNRRHRAGPRHAVRRSRHVPRSRRDHALRPTPSDIDDAQRWSRRHSFTDPHL